MQRGPAKLEAEIWARRVQNAEDADLLAPVPDAERDFFENDFSAFFAPSAFFN
jgi:hypothetical protein